MLLNLKNHCKDGWWRQFSIIIKRSKHDRQMDTQTHKTRGGKKDQNIVIKFQLESMCSRCNQEPKTKFPDYDVVWLIINVDRVRGLWFYFASSTWSDLSRYAELLLKAEWERLAIDNRFSIHGRTRSNQPTNQPDQLPCNLGTRSYS